LKYDVEKSMSQELTERTGIIQKFQQIPVSDEIEHIALTREEEKCFFYCKKKLFEMDLSSTNTQKVCILDPVEIQQLSSCDFLSSGLFAAVYCPIEQNTSIKLFDTRSSSLTNACMIIPSPVPSKPWFFSEFTSHNYNVVSSYFSNKSGRGRIFQFDLRKIPKNKKVLRESILIEESDAKYASVAMNYKYLACVKIQNKNVEIELRDWKQEKSPIIHKIEWKSPISINDLTPNPNNYILKEMEGSAVKVRMSSRRLVVQDYFCTKVFDVSAMRTDVLREALLL
jgi:hypothetical protein